MDFISILEKLNFPYNIYSYRNCQSAASGKRNFLQSFQLVLNDLKFIFCYNNDEMNDFLSFFFFLQIFLKENGAYSDIDVDR